MKQVLIIILTLIIFVGCSHIGIYQRKQNFSRPVTDKNGIPLAVFPQIFYLEIKPLGRVRFDLEPISDSPRLLYTDGSPVSNLEKGKWSKKGDTLIITFHLSSDYSIKHQTLIKEDSLTPSGIYWFDWVKKK
jgi:hypothetical protein